MALNFNTGPYYDDFDPAKNFYRVLFKPGYAVQARELNQLQSILQHQVSTFANHIFKKNSVVIPGGITLVETADIIQISGVSDPSVLVGKTITNATNFDYTQINDDGVFDDYITAVVLGYRNAIPATGTQPAQPAALYVKYFKTGSDGRTTFGYDLSTPPVLDSLRTVDQNLVVIGLDPTTPSTVGKVATINKGTYFTKDLFVDVDTQSIIVEVDNTKTTNCIIGLDIKETIVTSDDDESLLDNANGAPNQYAPGADRYKVSLTLNRYDRDAVFSEDRFIQLMEVENNIITYQNNNTQYAELMKTLARRTYDANGNFIVRGLETTTNPSSDDNYIWVNVNRGKCYLGGYEYEQITNRPIVIQKPRDLAHQETLPETTRFVNELTWFYVAGSSYLREVPGVNTLVQLLDGAPGTTGAKIIGYAVFKDLQYAFGDVADGEDIYRMFFDYVTFETGYSIADVGGIRSITVAEGAPVLHELRLTNQIGTFAPTNVVQAATDANIKGEVYNYIEGALYLMKNQVVSGAPAAIPAGDAVLNFTTSATATRSETFVSNHDDLLMPMIEVDTSVIKTLKVGANTPTSYSITEVREWTINNTSWTVPTALGGSDTYADYSPTNYSAVLITPNNTFTFNGGTAVNATTNTITIASHTFLTGDAVTYVNGGGTSIGGLTTGTVYYVSVVDTNTIKLATTRSAAVAGTTIDFSAVGVGASHNLTAVERTVDLTGKITVAPNSKTYTFKPESLYNALDGTQPTIRIYATVNKVGVPAAPKTVLSGDTIIRTPSASWTTLAHQDIVRVKKVFEGRTVSVDATNATKVEFNSNLNLITFTTVENHGLQAGNVIVTKNIKCSNFTDGLYGTGFNGQWTVNTTPSSTTFTISYTPNVKTFSVGTAVNTTNNTLTISSHGFSTGDAVTYNIGTGTPTPSAIGGLVDDTVYYVIVIDANTIQLATTRARAFSALPIDFTSVGVGTAQSLDELPPGTFTFADSDNAIVCAPPAEATGVDITNRFMFESGQTTSNVGTGLIKLKKRTAVPVGQLLVQYDYYSIDTSGSYGYVSVDSYDDLSGNLNYIGRIKDIVGPLKNVVEVRNQIDFRTRTSRYFFKNIASTRTGSYIISLKDFNLSNTTIPTDLVGKYVVGPDSAHQSGAIIREVTFNPETGNTDLRLSVAAAADTTGIYYVGLNTSSLNLVDTSAGGCAFTFPRDNYRIKYTYSRFKPKQTLVYIKRVADELTIDQMEITSLDDALKLRRNEYKLPLVYVNMDPYCVNMSNVRVTKFENPVYHMLDIHELRKKVDRTEYYASLALNGTSNQTIVDADDDSFTTAARGFWNENFMDMSVQDTTSEDYACTIYDRSYASPGVVTRTINLELDTSQSTNFVQNGSAITIPYKEQPAISNTVASRFNNLNPYNVIAWSGKLTLSPSVDNWVDTTVVPVIVQVPAVTENEPTPSTEPPVISPPIVVTLPPPVLPPPPVEEVVTEITNLKASWKGSCGNEHAITFDWKTNLGRTGRVNTDRHFSDIVRKLGKKGWNGEYANSLINKRYNDPGVKEYLNAGAHFDIKPPKDWKNKKTSDDKND